MVPSCHEVCPRIQPVLLFAYRRLTPGSLRLLRLCLAFYLVMNPVSMRAEVILDNQGQVTLSDSEGIHYRLSGIRMLSDTLTEDVRTNLHVMSEHLEDVDFEFDRYGERKVSALKVFEEASRYWLSAGHAILDMQQADQSIDWQSWLQLEDNARLQQLGEWRNSDMLKDARQPHHISEGFRLVTGVVKDVWARGDTVFLNFGENWRNDFTVRARASHMKSLRRRLEENDMDFEKMIGQNVRVRGFVFDANGPMIDLSNAAQLELLP